MKEKSGLPRSERKKLANHTKVAQTLPEPTKGKLNNLNRQKLAQLQGHLEQNGQVLSRRYRQIITIVKS